MAAKTAAPQVESLDITDAQAKKIVKLAIEHGAYSDDMPGDKAGRQEAAVEAVNFCIDSWVNDGVRPDDDDEDFAAAGEAILTIFKAAGIEVDKKDNVVLPEPDEADEEEDEDEDDNDGDDDSAAFDPNDYIEGYSDSSWKDKLAALKELDLEDEDTAGIVTAIKEWEEEQDKPSSRVLNWIEENLDTSDDEDDEDEDEEDDTEDDESGDGDENGEPWEGYDKASAVDIKKVLNAQIGDEDEPLTVEQVEYVKAYEESMKRPRKRVLDLCDSLIEQLGAEEDDDEEDEEPPKKALGRAKGRSSTKATTSKSKSKKAKDEPEAVTITVDDETVGEFDAAGLLGVFAALANALDNGATEITITTA